MIAPDTNLLLYAYNQSDPLHHAAQTYWEDALNGSEAIRIPVLCLHGFIRISTGNAYGGRRLSLDQASAIVNDWLSCQHVEVINPGPGHWHILRNLIIATNARGKLFTDAAIAAIAIEHGATVHTHDSDFARFPGLRWQNPLQT